MGWKEKEKRKSLKWAAETALDTWARSGQEIRAQSTEPKQASQEEVKLRGNLTSPEGLSKLVGVRSQGREQRWPKQSPRQRIQLQIRNEFPVFRNHTNKRPLRFSLIISLPHLTIPVSDRCQWQVRGCHSKTLDHPERTQRHSVPSKSRQRQEDSATRF